MNRRFLKKENKYNMRKTVNNFIFIIQILFFAPLESIGSKFLAFITSILMADSQNTARTANIPNLEWSIFFCSSQRSMKYWCIKSDVSKPWSFKRYSIFSRISSQFDEVVFCLKAFFIISKHPWRFEKNAGGRLF